MTSKVKVIHFDTKTVETSYYKNSHLTFGYDENNNPIFIFMTPSGGNTPGVSMELAFYKLIENPTLETTNEFLKSVPFIQTNYNEELDKLYQERLTNGIITKIGCQMFY